MIALAPSDDLGVIVQSGALGALGGSAIAAWFRTRDPTADAWLITTGGALFGAACGLVIVAGHRLRWW